MYEGEDVNNLELMFEWEEILLKDFLKGARQSLHTIDYEGLGLE